MDHASFDQFISWAFYGVVGGACVYGVNVLAHLKGGIDTLNIQIAKIIEKTEWHEKELDRHDRRLDVLELKKI